MTVAAGAVVALAAVFLSLYLKSQQKEITTLLIISASALLFFIVVRDAGKAVETIRTTIMNSSVYTEVETLVKALGIAMITQITADICREAGEGSIAGQVELIGKIEIVLLALPMAGQLLSISRELLS